MARELREEFERGIFGQTVGPPSSRDECDDPKFHDSQGNTRRRTWRSLVRHVYRKYDK